MSKQLKVHTEWLDSLGYSASVWLGGDWHQTMNLLSKLLATQLSERRSLESSPDVSFKIGYDSLSRLAEETLGIPYFVTEKDLMIQYPNIFLAQLLSLISIKHSVDNVNPKTLAAIQAPKLVFEARSRSEAQFPRCPACQEHVFFVERVMIETSVWHRKCFKCTDCGSLLRAGAYKKTKTGYECIVHAVRKILDEKEPLKSPRPKVAPPPAPGQPAPNAQLAVETADTNRLSSVSECSTEEAQNANSTSHAENEKGVKKKPVPPPKPKNLCSPKGKPMLEETASTSGDSGISTAYEQLSIATDKNMYESIENLPERQEVTKMREQKPAAVEGNTTPVAPPRPKRASLLLTASMTPPATPAISRLSMCSTSTPPAVAPKPSPRTVLPNVTKEETHYPDDLCPFGDDDDQQVNFEYDESKNPFADDSEEEEPVPVPARRTSIPTVCPQTDRPKFVPPPPPPMETDVSTPQKPSSFGSDNEKFRTLRLSKKKKRAPLPPAALVQRRRIGFTERDQLDDTLTIAQKVNKLDEEIEKVEREGRKLEMELLFLITTNPKDWYKLPRTEEYITTALKLLDTLREQSFQQYSWREAFLNEIHSETEYLLRCIVEKDAQDDYSCNREKQLTSLLIFIIDEKAKLTESSLDCDEQRRDSSMTRKENKKKTLKLRMAVLSKKLKSKKTKPST